MEAGLVIVGVMVLATITLLATRHFKIQDVRLQEDIRESERTGELIDEAMSKYPSLTQNAAIQQYAIDLYYRIDRLRANALNTDCLYAIKSDMRDRRLLLQELGRLVNLDIDTVSHFDFRKAAQV